MRYLIYFFVLWSSPIIFACDASEKATDIVVGFVTKVAQSQSTDEKGSLQKQYKITMIINKIAKTEDLTEGQLIEFSYKPDELAMTPVPYKTIRVNLRRDNKGRYKSCGLWL